MLTTDREEGPDMSETRPEWAPASIDLDRPSSARVWDYFLGGSHNFAVDRRGARAGLALQPGPPGLGPPGRGVLHPARRPAPAARGGPGPGNRARGPAQGPVRRSP